MKLMKIHLLLITQLALTTSFVNAAEPQASMEDQKKPELLIDCNESNNGSNKLHSSLKVFFLRQDYNYNADFHVVLKKKLDQPDVNLYYEDIILRYPSIITSRSLEAALRESLNSAERPLAILSLQKPNLAILKYKNSQYENEVFECKFY